jgi:N-acetylglucosamine-6-sulfatase
MENLQRLIARQGTTFENNFATLSLCCPSRATWLTGQYTHNHGVLNNQLPNGGYEKLNHRNTLPVWLQRGGYHTVHIGKYLNGYGRRNPTEIPAGWSEWYGSVDPTTYRFWNYTLNENGALKTYGSEGPAEGQNPALYQADVYTQKAVELIKRHVPKAKPLFLSVAYLAPHSGGPRASDDPPNMATPEPAPRHRNKFAGEALPMPQSFNEADVSDKPEAVRNRRPLTQAQFAAIKENYQQRLESLLAIDDGVEQIVAALRQTGELKNTVFMYTADNGFMHGEHRIPAGKVVVYEESIRVPLLMRGPGIRANAKLRQFAGNIDLAPTIADAAKVKAGRRLDGRSLLPLAKPRPARVSNRDILIEGAAPAQAARAGQRFFAIRVPNYVYVEHPSGEQELYDLAKDPQQLTSVHSDAAYAEIKQRLARRLAALKTCAGANCR